MTLIYSNNVLIFGFCSRSSLQVLTKDSVTILVDGVVYYRVFNPTMSIIKVEDANLATQMLAQTTLRNMLGTKSLADILRDREEMAEQMEVGDPKKCLLTITIPKFLKIRI